MKNIQKIPSVPNEDFVRSKKGYIIKRCPYKGCLAVVDRMTDHLVRKHKLARKSYQLKRMQMKAEDVPSTCEVSGRKRQNINKHIKKRTNFETAISSEEEPVKVKVKKEQKITLNIKIEKEDIILISSEEGNSCEEMMSDTNCCEEMLSDKSCCEEMMSDKNCCKESSEEKSSEESSEENSSGDDSSEESSQSSMLVTEDSGEESDEPEYYFQQREIQQFIKHLQRPLHMKAHKDALQHACQVYLVWGKISKKRIILID